MTRPGPVDLAPRPPHRGTVASVYVHAPFCAHRCPYCDYAVQVGGVGGTGASATAWLEALAGEIRALREEGRFVLADRLRTLYVGGGTPSLLGAGTMDALADVLGRERVADGDLEWTAEANPEDFTPELAGAWRRAGLSRIVLGVQSFQTAALEWLGRLHGAEESGRAVTTAREAGFEEIGVDLMFGLPERLDRSWTGDLERTVDLGVPHVNLYGLTVEPGTPLGRSVAEGRERVADETRYREQYLEAAERLTAAGYEHYEVSSFALPGSSSRHSRTYWGGTAYLGLGNSAHSYAHPLRRWNLASWNAYEERARQRRLPVADREILTPAEHRLERVWLGLRTRRGLALDALGPQARAVVREWVTDGLAEEDGDAVRLTATGWLVVDRLATAVDGALPPAKDTAASEPASPV